MENMEDMNVIATMSRTTIRAKQTNRILAIESKSSFPTLKA